MELGRKMWVERYLVTIIFLISIIIWPVFDLELIRESSSNQAVIDQPEVIKRNDPIARESTGQPFGDSDNIFSPRYLRIVIWDDDNAECEYLPEYDYICVILV